MVDFVAAAVKASVRLPTWSSRSPTVYSGQGVGPSEHLVGNVADQDSHALRGRFQVDDRHEDRSFTLAVGSMMAQF